MKSAMKLTAPKELTRMTALLSVCLLLAPGPCRAFSFARSPEDVALVWPMRQAGLHRDRSQVPQMVDILARTKDIRLTKTVLHSLVQIGATEALPDIDAFIRASPYASLTTLNANVVNYARVERARLVAETSATGVADGKARAGLVVARFYQELALTPAQVNAAVARYYEGLAAHPVGPDQVSADPAELFAMREVADMAYHGSVPPGSWADYAALPGVAQLQFALDAPSALKMRLAPLSPDARTAWLIDDLANKAVLADDADREIQLASDIGTPAGVAAEAKLRQMEQDRGTYEIAGFDALFGVVIKAEGEIGNPVVKHFEANPDPRIAQLARDGGAGQMVAGY